MGFLAGKRILLTGLLSNRSIAYGIAQARASAAPKAASTRAGANRQARRPGHPAGRQPGTVASRAARVLLPRVPVVIERDLSGVRCQL